VLLPDEPTSSLGPVAAESIEALVHTLVPSITEVIVPGRAGARFRPETNQTRAWLGGTYRTHPRA
jgi:ABC-type phosphate transport system ATPase subunit